MDIRHVGKLLSNTRAAAQDIIDSSKDAAVQAIDQNGDGRLDLADAAVAADAVGHAVKKGTYALKKGAGKTARELERATLQPIFLDEINANGGCLPSLIYIAERDAKHAQSKVCQGSIGYYSYLNKLQTWNVFTDSIGDCELSFYPGLSTGIFYVDPMDPQHYIELKEYFNYQKKKYVAELEDVAETLGARHYRITYREEKKSSSDLKARGHVKAPAADVDAAHAVSQQDHSILRIEAEASYEGHDPKSPDLYYLEKEPDIQLLVKKRLDNDSQMHNRHVSIDLCSSFGIAQEDVAKIDAIQKGMKVKVDSSIKSKIRNEVKRSLEYEIEF